MEKPPGAPGTPDPKNSPRYWFGRFEGELRVPFASMDIMAYSYSGRSVLAKMSRVQRSSPGRLR